MEETSPGEWPIAAVPVSGTPAGAGGRRTSFASRIARRASGHLRRHGAAAVLVLAAAVAATAGAGGAPRRFGLVLVCPPPAATALARRRGYLPAGQCPGGTRPLGKLLLAVPGDLIEASAAGLGVDGCLAPFSQPLAADSAGRPLPRAAFGRRRLAPGEVWVYAPHPRSFDSRYFGPVPTASLRGTLVPLWVTSASTSDRILPDLLARRHLPTAVAGRYCPRYQNRSVPKTMPICVYTRRGVSIAAKGDVR